MDSLILYEVNGWLSYGKLSRVWLVITKFSKGCNTMSNNEDKKTAHEERMEKFKELKQQKQLS